MAMSDDRRLIHPVQAVVAVVLEVVEVGAVWLITHILCDWFLFQRVHTDDVGVLQAQPRRLGMERICEPLHGGCSVREHTVITVAPVTHVPI